MINRIIKALENRNIELNHREIADAIWLALKMYEMEQSQNDQKSKVVYNEQSHLNSSETILNNNLNNIVTNDTGSNNDSQPTKTDTEPDYKKEPTDVEVPLHIAKNRQSPNSEQFSKSIPTKVPTSKTLPKQLEIARALKPLLQKKDSNIEYVIDEEATARRIKEENIWFPVLRPKLISRYNLELIIDISESMEIWQKTITEFELLLKRHGAFGNVQSWLIDTDKESLPLSKKASGVKQSSLRSYKELSSIGNDNLVLIISDCVSSAWYEKEITEQINFWSKTNCVAILQVFPKTLWRHTSLGKRPIVEVETINNKVNAKLKPEVTDFDIYQSEELIKNKQPESVIVPVITFESVIINSWASSLTGIPDFWVVGAKFLVGETIVNNKEKNSLSAKQIVQNFYANASPTARNLAGYLSLLPFDFSIVNIVRELLVKEAQQSHIAEVLLSGLIKKLKVQNNKGLSVIYDFVEGTREIIMNTNFDISIELDNIESNSIQTRITQIQIERKKIINDITKYIIDNQGSTKDFIGLIKSIKGVLNTELSEPFANIKTEILKIVDKEYNSNNPNEFDIDNTIVSIEETDYNKPGIKSSYSIKIKRNNILLPITNFVWSKSDSLLAIVGVGGYITIVNTINKKEKWSKILESEISAISWSPDNEQLALGTAKGTIYLLNAKTGEILKTLSEHQDKIYSVEWVTRNKTSYDLVSCSADQTIRKWDSQTYEHKHTGKWPITNLEAIAWTPNWDSLATISDNNQLKVWNLDADSWHSYDYKIYERATALCSSLDGKHLVIGLLNGDIALTPWPNQENSNKPIFFKEHKERINSINLSADNKFLVSKALDNTIRLWYVDLSIDNQEQLLEIESQSINRSLLSALAFDPQELVLATLDHASNLHILALDVEELLIKHKNSVSTKIDLLNANYAYALKDLETSYVTKDISHNMLVLRVLEEQISRLLSSTELQKWRNENSRFIHLLQRGTRIWNEWKAENKKEEVDLSNHDLSIYNFNLNSINLKGVKLKESNLSRVDLTKAQLNNADLSGAILDETKLDSANLVKSKLVKAQLQNNNIRYGDFAGVDFTETDLTDTVLTNLNLDETNFTNAILVNTKFINCTLVGTNFKGSIWDNTLLSNCDLLATINIENINHKNISILKFSKPTSINRLHPTFLKHCLILQPFTFTTAKLNAKGKVVNQYAKQANQIIEDLGNGITLEMVKIPSGEFMMGSPEGKGYKSEKPQHKVTIPTFYMGKYQVTQEQWEAIMGSNPSRFKGSGKLPVERVSWDDAIEFCKRLSEKTNKIYRLPSEAEWEYACRAGTEPPFAFGETINTDIVNYNGDYPYGEGAEGEYRAKTTVVGSLGVANKFGLYDMHGNVWEWCQDGWHDSYNGAPTDGSVRDDQLSNNTDRVLRGGSYYDYAAYCRSAYRDGLTPVNRNSNIGLRLVMAARTLK